MKKVLGAQGEWLAQSYLKKKHYAILEHNFKNKIGEIDIIAKQKNVLVFVEVKTRTNTAFGLPREAVHEQKQHKIRLVAQSYLQKTGQSDCAVRFDVIEILNDQIMHLENAF